MASPPPDRLRQVDRVLAPVTWLIALWAVVVLFAGPELIGAEKETAAAGAQQSESQAPAEPAESGADGAAVFADAGCGGCHTLAAADASGGLGPNLDEAKPDAATVAAVVTNGQGGMPSFGDQLSEAEIQAVADYVASSAGG